MDSVDDQSISTMIPRSAAVDCPNDENKNKPQLLEQQPDVVTGTVHNRVDRIPEHTFVRVSPESSIGLRLSDG